MKIDRIYIVLLAALILAGCGTKKKTVTPVVEEPVVVAPAWHTCLIQGARATISRNADKLSATVTMQTVRDSMIIISVMPLFGMEMMRIEATPLEVKGFDKIHGQYVQATFAELNRKLQPQMNWDILQEICTAELPTGDQKGRLLYAFEDETIELVIDYVPRKLDLPLRMVGLDEKRYTKIDISKWL